MKDHFHFDGRGYFSIDYDSVILDPSVLFYLTTHEIKETQIEYCLPDNLINLIKRSKDNKEYQQFLKSFLTYFRYDFSDVIQSDDWNLFYQNIDRMTINPISKEDLANENQDDYYEKYLNLFSDHNFFISMSPIINFLGDCIAKIMEFSKKTGKIILSKSRKLANLLKEKITSLELPKHLDNLVQTKSLLINKMFDFQGGRSTKFFIGITLGVGGFIHPVIGGIGVVFTFMDP